MQHDPSQVIQRYFNELFNQGRTELIETLIHPDYVNHSPGTPDLPRGRSGIKLVVEGMRSAFPDLHYTIEDMVLGSDAVAVRSSMRGTQHGDFFGLPATGRPVAVAQYTIERFRDGRIVAHHRLTDELALMRQLGAL
jgi:steroid delta-isomerase-like uncharacterized protein